MTRASTSSATTTAIPTIPRRPPALTRSARGRAMCTSSWLSKAVSPWTPTPSSRPPTAVRSGPSRWRSFNGAKHRSGLIDCMPRPIVAIVGRPNVGKSTLFNRILGWRKAIVDPQSGLTRDRLYGVADWRGREFTVVDTAGLDMDGAKDESRAAIEAQTRVAIDQADVIVLLLDVRQGLTPVDREIAQLLRRSGRHILVAANKADSPSERHFAHEILELGFDEPNLVSAQHGLGIGDFLDR